MKNENAEQPAQQEPFGYFKAEPFGWTDCAETDEGAVALYTSPPAQQEPVAWYVERQHVGFRDHGLKCGPFWKLSEAEEWTDSCHILKGLYATPPAQRKPLTPREYNIALALVDIKPSLYEAVTRAIEAAHGIKENT